MILYFNRRPPCVVRFFRKAAIFCAAAAWSRIGIGLVSHFARVELSGADPLFQKVKEGLAPCLGAASCLDRLAGLRAHAASLSRALGGNLAHLLADAGAVHDRLLDYVDHVAERPVKRQPRAQIPG